MPQVPEQLIREEMACYLPLDFSDVETMADAETLADDLVSEIVSVFAVSADDAKAVADIAREEVSTYHPNTIH